MATRTNSPDNLITDEQRCFTELSEVLRGILDGVGTLDVLRWRLEEAFRDFVWVDHRSSRCPLGVVRWGNRRGDRLQWSRSNGVVLILSSFDRRVPVDSRIGAARDNDNLCNVSYH